MKFKKATELPESKPDYTVRSLTPLGQRSVAKRLEMPASRYRDTASERSLELTVLEMLAHHGWDWWHDAATNDPDATRRNKKGWPDITCWKPGVGVAFLELKTATGRVKPEQARTIAALAESGVVARVVRPADLDALQAFLETGRWPDYPAETE